MRNNDPLSSAAPLPRAWSVRKQPTAVSISTLLSAEGSNGNNVITTRVPQAILATPPNTPTEAPTPADAMTSDDDRLHECTTSDQDTSADRYSPTYPAPLLEFSAEAVDYEILWKQPLGSGRFSTVYLADPVEPSNRAARAQDIIITPPNTPTESSFPAWTPPASPRAFAVKIPADRQSIPVLHREAAILSYLAAHHDHGTHIVPFHGLDARADALVLTALPSSLDGLITGPLAGLAEESRTAAVAGLLPSLASSLAASLSWLHATGLVHADIKPANILLRPAAAPEPAQPLFSTPLAPLLSDFTSAFHVDAPPPPPAAAATTTAVAAPLGGGTGDFLAPELLRRPFPLPTPASDRFALALSLLVLVVGQSPYAAAPSRFVRLEWVRLGRPLEFVRDGAGRPALRLEGAARRIREAAPAWDLVGLLERGFSGCPEERLIGWQ